jgi:uncharacterized protein (UPF0297 family)
MTLREKLQQIYPSLTVEDFMGINQTIYLQDNGQGAYIAKWEHPTLAKPTDEELA